MGNWSNIRWMYGTKSCMQSSRHWVTMPCQKKQVLFVSRGGPMSSKYVSPNASIFLFIACAFDYNGTNMAEINMKFNFKEIYNLKSEKICKWSSSQILLLNTLHEKNFLQIVLVKEIKRALRTMIMPLQEKNTMTMCQIWNNIQRFSSCPCIKSHEWGSLDQMMTCNFHFSITTH